MRSPSIGWTFLPIAILVSAITVGIALGAILWLTTALAQTPSEDEDDGVRPAICQTPRTPNIDDEATPGDGRMTVSWSEVDPPSEHGIIFYQVQRRLSGGDWPTSAFGTITTTSKTVTGLKAGVEYDFRVRAGEYEDGDDNCFSGWSGSVSGTPTTTLEFDSSSYSVREGSSTNIGAEVNVAPGVDLSAEVVVDPGVHRTLTISSMSTSGNFSYSARHDSDCDDETVKLSIGDVPPWVNKGSPSKATLSIDDDDINCGIPTPTPPPDLIKVMFSTGDYIVDEGSNVNIVVRLDPPSSQKLEIPVKVSGSSDVELTFPSNDTSESFSYSASDDSDCDDERVNLSFGKLPEGVVEGSPSTATITIDDDDTRCGSPTPTSPPPPPPPPRLPTPAGLDVAPENQVFPLKGRRAILRWDAVTGATGYIVEVRRLNGTWQRPNNGSSTMDLAVTDGETDTNHYYIDLEDIINISKTSWDVRGLADSPYVYEFRVKATRGSQESAFSDEIRIIDTPITVANGYSPGIGPDSGEASIEWTPVPGASNYTVRSRKLPDVNEIVSHTSPDWYALPAQSSGDWEEEPETTGTSSSVDRLTRGEIHAIQLTYEYTVFQGPGLSVARRGFSAREAYVWPSHREAGAVKGGERIASYFLRHPLPHTEFKYRICEDTFPDGIMPNGKDRRKSWRNAVRDALEQWEVATAGLITMTHETYFSPEANNGQGAWFSFPCTDYAHHIQRLANEIETNENYAFVTPGNKLTSDQIESLGGFLDSIATLTMLRTNDAYWSEIDMVDPGDYQDFVRVGAFPELSRAVGFVGCFFGRNERACALTRPNGGDDRYSISTDISLNLNGSGIGTDPPLLAIGDADITGQHETVPPTKVRFNKCLVQSSRAYEVLVHEAAHALGISDHPFPGSRYTALYSKAGVGCHPHPFDIMAIYAMYQSRNAP